MGVTPISTNQMKNKMLVMVLTDLAAICEKLGGDPILPQELQQQAQSFVAEFNALLPVRGKGTPAEHANGEKLLIKIARFLPRVVEVQAEPATLQQQ